MHTLHYSDLRRARWAYDDYIAAGQFLAAVLLALALVVGWPLLMVMGG